MIRRPSPTGKRMLQQAARLDKSIDKRIERLYYASCYGVQIDIMDIRKVFQAGRDAIAKTPGISDEALTAAIVWFVNTIRKN